MKTSINVEFTPEELNALYPKLHNIRVCDPEDDELHSGIKKLILAYRDNVSHYCLTVDKITAGTVEDGTKFIWAALCYDHTSLTIRYEKPLFQSWILEEGTDEPLPNRIRTYWHAHADSVLDKLHANEKNITLFIPNVD